MPLFGTYMLAPVEKYGFSRVIFAGGLFLGYDQPCSGAFFIAQCQLLVCLEPDALNDFVLCFSIQQHLGNPTFYDCVLFRFLARRANQHFEATAP